ncbi:MAG: glycyl-radical enzyme activating protein [Spirochaetes bacterium]|nr:glycyl-radical enzyme activating protein [Spirochaetota bacterium]
MTRVNGGDITGTIFDIQRFSVHDGPGIRTTVFFKGCPLRCVWCHNPESKRMDPELFFENGLCTLCGECVRACPHNLHSIVDGGRKIERSRCTRCGRCVDACLTGALAFKGRRVTADEVMKEILKDKEYYTNSGGGITLSGGEPLAQPDFSKALLVASKEYGVNTAIETCGYAEWELFERLLAVIDYVMYDIKIIDPDLHKKYCGTENRQILDNLTRLIQSGKETLVRIPLIPEITDTMSNLHGIGAFLKNIAVKKVELIPYHSFAEDKCNAVGQNYLPRSHEMQDTGTLETIRRLISEYGMETKVGI